MAIGLPIAIGLGPNEMIIIVLFVVLLILGPKKLPELFRAVGKSMGELKKGMKESEEEMEQEAAKEKKKKTATKKKSKK